MSSSITKIKRAIGQRWVHHRSNQRWASLSKKVAEVPLGEGQRPVIFFNASTRLQAMSQNAAYSYLAALGLRQQGVPVVQFVCMSGLSRCVLGSNRDDYTVSPPCELCIRQSSQVFKNFETAWFEYVEDPDLASQVDQLSFSELENFEFRDKPVGSWAVNSLRWMLRRHNLLDNAPTRNYFKAYILSAWNVYTRFSSLLKEKEPQAVVLFNGMFFPEAAARQAALDHDVKVITHEVGLRPFTAFLTTGQATAYPIDIDPGFQLTLEMDQRLNDYLEKRLKGEFSMAGIRFWPEIKGLPEKFTKLAERYEKIVPVFTNVIFDTSQVHANTIFPNMFAWLDDVMNTARKYPNVLFVIRAHPDECRPGKESRESVAFWMKAKEAQKLLNVLFVESNQYISSYELIQKSHLVMVYNSTIGLEATLLGKPVLTGGKARYTQLTTSYYPGSRAEYNALLEDFLQSDHIKVPDEFVRNARRFLYFQLFVTSLDFGDFVQEDGIWKGYVRPRDFQPRDLSPQRSTTMRVLLDGILRDNEFHYQP